MMQRIFDIVFSMMALLVLSPLMIPLVIILRLSGEGEIFYKQNRVGKGGVSFGLLKFATMLKNSPNLGTGNMTVKNDPRILPLGNFLRKTKINELPQLLNIFLGDMSIIGPRPLTQDHFDGYIPCVQQAIISVQPGLSGIGSIVFRAEEEMLHQHDDAKQFYKEYISPYKGTLEAWYVNNNGLWTYFTLIILTIWVVFFSKSIAVWNIFPSLPKPPAVLEKYFL
ncbi:WcaJ Sugar transferases involved in lipopolysaccharide synthesis [Methylophilaceae bacterium]